MNVLTGQIYLTEEAIKAAKERGEPIAMLEGVSKCPKPCDAILSGLPVMTFEEAEAGFMRQVRPELSWKEK